MAPDQVDATELELRRAAMEQPLDSRQRVIKLGLDLVAAWRRATLLHTGAVEQCERMRRSFLEAGQLLREAVELLDSADAMTAHWMAKRDALLKRYRGQ